MYSFHISEETKKVLIVGDTHFVRNVFGRFFQEHGYEIASVGGEPEEISAGIRMHPEVVIVDYEMHHNDPYLVTAILHDALPSSRIALLNGHSRHCNEVEARLAGAQKVISRSCNASVLEDIICATQEVCL